MKFHIEKIEGKHVVLDQDGVQYGRYDNKTDAEVAIAGWLNYYEEEDTNVVE
jgi:hypothetical protein